MKQKTAKRAMKNPKFGSLKQTVNIDKTWSRINTYKRRIENRRVTNGIRSKRGIITDYNYQQLKIR